VKIKVETKKNNMRTQQYIQVEAIVAKYRTLASNNEAVKSTSKSVTGTFIPQDIARLDFMEQLIARIYQLRAGENAHPDVVAHYSEVASYYIEGLLTDIEEQYLVDHFGEFVDYAFEHTNTIVGLWDDDFDSPNEWSCLVPYLLDSNVGKIFIANSDSGREFMGLSNCEITVASGFSEAAIRALACGKSIKAYQGSKSLEKLWADIDPLSYNAVIVDMRNCRSTSGSEKSVEECFNACKRIVKDGGDILLCLSKDSVLSDNTLSLRSQLISGKILKEVISLPSGNLLLHIVKSPQNSFVACDISQLSKKSNDREVDLEAFLKELDMAEMPERDKCPIIRRYDYDNLDERMLLPTFYLRFPKEGAPIGTFTSICSDEVLSDECGEDEKVVTVNNLSTVFTRGAFNVDELPSIKRDKLRRYHRVEGPAVVMAVSEQDVAIGYTTDSATFLVPRNLYVLKPLDEVDVKYVACILLSKTLKTQLSALVYGKGIQAKLVTNWDKLILVNLPSDREQQEYIQQTILQDYSTQQSAVESQEKGFKYSIRLRKHALSQNISAFDSLFSSLEFCMNEHNGHLIADDQVSPISSMTVGEAMDILRSNLMDIRERVARLTDDNDWGKCETIEPQKFIEEYENKHMSSSFRFEHLWEPFETNSFTKDVFDRQTGKLLFHKGDSINAAWFPRKALMQVFDNIVTNAREHGFTDSNRKDYTIRTSWDTDGLNMLIKISNNGAPLHADVNENLVLEYGYSTALNHNGHGGIGGGEIAEIMRRFGGNVSVISSPDKAFTVTYVLTLPLASIY
jgi:hypothetical protein